MTSQGLLRSTLQMPVLLVPVWVTDKTNAGAAFSSSLDSNSLCSGQGTGGTGIHQLWLKWLRLEAEQAASPHLLMRYRWQEGLENTAQMTKCEHHKPLEVNCNPQFLEQNVLGVGRSTH